MNDLTIILKEFDCEIIKEIFNISIERAAVTLSEILGRKITLIVPELSVINKEAEKDISDNFLFKSSIDNFLMSSITFESNFHGRIDLVFSADKMRTLIDLCTGEIIESTDKSLEFTDIDFDIIKEIGNMVLNSLVGEAGNFLKMNFNYSLPEVKAFSKIDFENALKNSYYDYAAILHITFTIDDVEIHGGIVINLTLTVLNDLLLRISKIGEEMYG